MANNGRVREATMLALGHRALHVGLVTERELRRFTIVAALGLIVLNAFDLMLTRHLLGMGAREANPLMASIISGPIGPVVKIVGPMLLALRYLTAPTVRRTALGLGVVVVLYCAVVLWNLHQLLTRVG